MRGKHSLGCQNHSAGSRRNGMATWVNEVLRFQVLRELFIRLGSSVKLGAILHKNGAAEAFQLFNL
jgi:hypothetical protein